MPSLEDLPIAITMGDPCGIGPEIVAKIYADVAPLPPILVLGDEGIIRRALRLLALPLTVRVIDSPQDFQYTPQTIYLLGNLTYALAKRRLIIFEPELSLPCKKESGQWSLLQSIKKRCDWQIFTIPDTLKSWLTSAEQKILE